tara:strand:- start:87 stop:995 length:909 start_codon:yes stop_codon:yes gene_type:complete
MKVYIKNSKIYGAWYWIYKGYDNAWKSMGYDTEFYDTLDDIDTDIEFDVMVYDIEVQTPEHLEILSKARKAYMFVSPNHFVQPWGSHPNWLTPLSDQTIEAINSMDNIHLWAFINADRGDFYNKWKKVNRVSMAFDHHEYKPVEDSKYAFDICYVGSWANNGFDEKKKIMIDHFSELKKTNLKCGIFIHKGVESLTIEEEAKLIFNSKIPINLHDNYQRILGLEHNERTYKTLGLNGFVVSDRTNILEEEFSHIPMAENPVEMVKLIEEYMDQDLTEIKNKNIENILKNHTYHNRIEQFLEL